MFEMNLISYECLCVFGEELTVSDSAGFNWEN